MDNAILFATIVIGIIIVILTMLQGKGGGMGSAWGGAGTFQTRRGVEKWMLRATAVLVGVFFLISVLNLLT